MTLLVFKISVLHFRRLVSIKQTTTTTSGIQTTYCPSVFPVPCFSSLEFCEDSPVSLPRAESGSLFSVFIISVDTVGMSCDFREVFSASSLGTSLSSCFSSTSSRL